MHNLASIYSVDYDQLAKDKENKKVTSQEEIEIFRESLSASSSPLPCTLSDEFLPLRQLRRRFAEQVSRALGHSAPLDADHAVLEAVPRGPQLPPAFLRSILLYVVQKNLTRILKLQGPEIGVNRLHQGVMLCLDGF